MKNHIVSFLRFFLLVVFIAGVAFQPQYSVYAAANLTVTPLTWNVIGLDSNSPVSGPYRFPVGARVCNTAPGTTTATNVVVDFVWDSANPNINLRAGSLDPIAIASLPVGSCSDAYFEVEVNQVAAAYDTFRQYHITATDSLGATGSTPTPRALYVEHLISQNRNAITDVRLNGASIPAGGSMNLLVGNTYTIGLFGGTATQGYEQFEAFINFPNTIFQILSVNTTYSANTSSYVTSPNDKLYADACLWENDPNSPNYRACVGTPGKTGGSNVVTTYTIRIISGGGTTQTLNTLLYDFSGSSYHYNADYSTGVRFANIIDPTNVTIAKSFSPNPGSVNGVSALTITITNPNPGAISGYNFTDPLPANMSVASTPGATTTSCGSPTFAPLAGATSISFTNGAIAANGTCTIKVNVTTTATGTFNNTTNTLFVDALDTGRSATALLTVNNAPPLPTPPSTCAEPVELARWTMAPPQGTTVPPAYFSKAANVATALASYVTVSGTNMISTAVGNPVNAWGGTAPTAGDGWRETASSMNNYFQFVLDTSNYGGVFVTFDGRPDVPGDWANPASNVYINTSANGGAFTAYTPVPQAVKDAWTTLTTAAVPTGTATTTFRFGVDGSGNNKTGAMFYLDNVIFFGCAAPTPPTITKAFLTNPIPVNGISTLRFTLSNSNSIALNGVTFTDALPNGLQVAATPVAATTCGGTPTWAPGAGASLLTFGSPVGATIPAGSSCTISVNIIGTASGAYQNVSGFISSTNGGTNTSSTGSASASLSVIKPPSIAKLFSPNPILANGTSKLTFTITNPNQNDALNGLSFTDTFPLAPGAMTVAAPLTTTNSCGGTLQDNLGGALASGDAGIRLITGGPLAGGSSCTVTVNVTAATVGSYTNTSGAVASTNGGTGNTASDTLTVDSPNPAIALLKQISTSPTGPWTSYITVEPPTNVYYQFTIENSGDVTLSPVSVSDPTISGEENCAWPNTLPVADINDNDHIATCVVGPVVSATGVNTNTAAASGTFGGTPYTSTSSSATYSSPAVTLVKSVTETSFDSAGDTLSYSYLVTNSGFAPLLGPVTVTDDKVTVTCPPVNTVGDLDAWFDPGESLTCTAIYTVTAADMTAALVTNTASASASTVTSNDSSVTVYRSLADLTVTKVNNANGSVPQNGTFDWTITVTNNGIADAVFANTNVIMSDTLPGVAGYYSQTDLLVDDGAIPPTGSIYCVILGIDLSCEAVSPVTIPVGGSFSVTFSVTPTAAGSLSNTVTVDPNGNVTEIDETNNAGTNVVTVVAPPTITKSFGTDPVALNDTSIITFTITNPAVNTVPLTNVSFADIFPAGLQFVAPPNQSTTCLGGFSLTATNLPTPRVIFNLTSLPVNTSCSVTVTVTAISEGTLTNNVAASSNNGGTGNTATDTLAVVTPPSIVKSFFPNPTAANIASTLTFIITNPNTSTDLTGIAFSDTYPLGLVNATPLSTTNTCGGTLMAVAGDGSISLSGGSITVNDIRCTITVSVVAASSGTYVNTTDNVTSTNGGVGNTASYALNVFEASPSKSIAATSESFTSLVVVTERVAIGEMVRYRLATLIPKGAFTNVQLLDGLPTGLQFMNDGTARVAFVCNGGAGCMTSSTLAGAGLVVNGSSATISPTFTLPGTAISSGPFNSGTDVTFSVGNITNSDADVDSEFIVVEFNALVLNINSTATINQGVDNQTGASNTNNRQNDVTLRINGATVGETSPNVTVSIAEPAITAITKSVVPATGPYLPGDALIYTMSFSNTAAGFNAATAFDIVLTDTFNVDLTLGAVNISSTQGTSDVDTCAGGTSFTTGSSTAGQLVTVNISCLDPGETVTVTVAATIDLTSSGTIISNSAGLTYTSLPGAQGNCAAAPFSCSLIGTSGAGTGERNGVGGPGADGVVLNNYAVTSNTVNSTIEYGNITITKDVVPDNPQDFNFTGSGTNFAVNFTVDDDSDPTLVSAYTFLVAPGSYSFTEGAVAGWSLTGLTCTDPDSGSTTDLGTATATIDLDAGENIICTFTNTGNTADLAITKTDGVTNVNAGGTTTYTVRVTNNGPSSVTGAILSDLAATGLNKTGVACSAIPGQCVTAPTVAQIEGGTFALPALASGEFYEITVIATVIATSGNVTNSATVTEPAGMTDPGPNNNTDSDIDTVNPIADLAITKTDGVTGVNVGGTTTYTIRVTNNGPSNVSLAILGDPVVAGLSKTVVACSATPSRCVTPPTVVELESNTFTLPDLASGQFYEITVTADVTAASGSVTNTASVYVNSPGIIDPDTNNNTASDTDTVNPIADLAITKTDGVAVVTAGGTTTYTIVVTNNGPSAVIGALITDAFPTNIISASWNCVASAGSACITANGAGDINTNADLLVNGTVAFTVTANISASSGNLVNTATVNPPAGTNDPALANNSASDTDAIIDIDAVNDTGSTVNGTVGGQTLVNVLTNDTLNGDPVSLVNVNLTQISATNPGVTLEVTTGAVNVAPGTPAGNYTVTYQICDQANPTFCDTATVSVPVVVINAVNDTGSSVNGYTGGQSFANVLTNDTLNGNPATLANITLTQVSTTNAGVTLNTADGSVNVAAGTPAGNYTVTYQICDQASPTICDTATVSVPVTAAPINAVDDSATGVNGLTGATNVLNVFTNDTLNGVAVVPAEVTLTQQPGGAPELTLNPNGSVDVAPGTVAGTYQLTYEICEVLNPTNCDIAVVRVTVGLPPVPTAIDDSTTTPFNTPATLPNITSNDTAFGPGNSIVISTIDLDPAPGPQTTFTDVSSNQWSVNATTGNVTFTPALNFTGVATIPYTVQDATGQTATANLSVTVAPPASISGVVFHDVDLDGSKLASESGIVGVIVNLYDSTGTTLIASTTTGAGGTYNFTNLPPGSYTVVEIDPAGYVSSTSNNVPVTVASGATGTVNFGDYQLSNTALSNISGVVFNDANGNGVQDAGEILLSGVTVELENNLGIVIATTTTNASGGYTFANLPAGTYTVVETDLPGYISTTLNNIAVTLSAGTNTTVNFGDQTVVGNPLIADPAVTKLGSPSSAVVGDVVVYTITVGNNGNTNATNVILTDTKPAFLDIISISISPNPGLTPVINGNTFSINFGTVAPADLYTITVITRVNTQGVPPGGVNNAAITTSSGTDRTFNNASAVQLIITLRGGNPSTVAAVTTLPDTGFAPNVVTSLPLQPSNMLYAATDLILEIPSLGVKMPIVGVSKKNGAWDVTWLGKQAGWLEGTAFPSWNGNSVLTSHVYDANGLPGPFLNLGKLKYGDKIIIHAYGQKYTFEVRTNQTVAPNDTSALKHEEKPWLTLVTCKEYDEKTNTYKKRVIVRAVLVSVDWDK